VLERGRRISYPTPADPRHGVDAALPNFHEAFITTTLQPYAEYGLKVGVKPDHHARIKLRRTTSRTSPSSPTIGKSQSGAWVVRPLSSTQSSTILAAVARCPLLIRPTGSVYGSRQGQNIPPLRASLT